MTEEIYYRKIEQKDRRLGRNVFHDPRSRAFAIDDPIDTSVWKNTTIRIYDPWPRPNQCHGECTGVAQCVMFNSVGNRVSGKMLDMNDAHDIYGLGTTLDPFPGAWVSPSWQDTGSSGLAVSKASQKLGYGGTYRHEFRGVLGVVDTIIRKKRVVSLGTRWDWRMFEPDSAGIIEPGGGEAGGHQWIARRVDVDRELLGVYCWWNKFDVWLRWNHASELLADNGDAHTQDRLMP